jgi:hypothetical protein
MLTGIFRSRQLPQLTTESQSKESLIRSLTISVNQAKRMTLVQTKMGLARPASTAWVVFIEAQALFGGRSRPRRG